MVKKKLLAIVAAAAMVVPSFSFAVSAKAAKSDLVLEKSNIKFLQDFNSFEDGMRVGKDGNKAFRCLNNTDEQKINFHIADGVGANASNGLSFCAMEGINAQQGVFEGVEYYPSKDANGRTNWKGASDFVFWIDCTKETEKTASVQIVLQEIDFDAEGNVLIDEDTNKPFVYARNLYSDAHAKWYTMSDEDVSKGGTWEEHQGIDSYWIHISNTFKGYVRVPIKDFFTCWETAAGMSCDDDENADLSSLVAVGIYTGMWPRHVANSQSIAIDNMGFAGEFEDIAPTTATTSDDKKTTSDDKKTTSDDKKTTSDDKSKDTDKGEKKSEDNPATGEMPITAAAVTAVIFAGVVVASKKKNK